MSELKPCPFCGASEDDIQFRDFILPPNVFVNLVYCRQCGGALIDTDKNHCLNDRIIAWNRRVTDG